MAYSHASRLTGESSWRDAILDLDKPEVGKQLAAWKVCSQCGSEDVETYEAEHADEPDIQHCHNCGHDEKIT